MNARAKLTDALAYGCSRLLVLGMAAGIIATVIGWVGVPRERAVEFLGATRLLLIFGFLLVAGIEIVHNRRRLAAFSNILRPSGASTMLNLIRVGVIGGVMLLLFAAGIAVTPFTLPYLFYDILRMWTCLAWVSVVGVAAARDLPSATDLGLLAFGFIMTFTPVIPLHLAQIEWAVVDTIAALSLVVTLSSVLDEPAASAQKTTTVATF